MHLFGVQLSVWVVLEALALALVMLASGCDTASTGAGKQERTRTKILQQHELEIDKDQYAVKSDTSRVEHWRARRATSSRQNKPLTFSYMELDDEDDEAEQLPSLQAGWPMERTEAYDQKPKKSGGFIELAPEVQTHLSRSSGQQRRDSWTEQEAKQEEWQHSHRKQGYGRARQTATQHQSTGDRLGGATSAAQRGASDLAISSSSAKSHLEQQLNRHYLDTTSVPLEVQAEVGTTAYLYCRLRTVQQAQEHLQVSWVRNMSILTTSSGTSDFRYTSDERFEPTHSGDTWLLLIHNVNANDEGAYECQVNSEPKPASVSLYLSVVAASIEILAPNPLQVAEDEQIKLTCRVEFYSNNSQLETRQFQQQHTQEQQPARAPSITAQHYIYWYKDDRYLVENKHPRRDLHKGPNFLESELTVDKATPSDAGLYKCQLMPEMKDVMPVECQVRVGGASVGSGAAIPNLLLASQPPQQLALLLILTLFRISLLNLPIMCCQNNQ